MERKQFTFYRSFFEAIENLPTKKEKADAYDLLCSYALFGTAPDLKGKSPLVATLFAVAKPVLDTAHKRAELAQKLSQRQQKEEDIV